MRLPLFIEEKLWGKYILVWAIHVGMIKSNGWNSYRSWINSNVISVAATSTQNWTDIQTVRSLRFSTTENATLVPHFEEIRCHDRSKTTGSRGTTPCIFLDLSIFELSRPRGVLKVGRQMLLVKCACIFAKICN